MSLITQIKAAQIAARKLRDQHTTASLTTLIGEAEMVGKNAGRDVTDAEVIATVKKFIKNIEATIEALKSSNKEEALIALHTEKLLYEQFLPRQMTEQQLIAAVESIKAEFNATQKDMGKVMTLLKQRHDGTYDGKMASTVVKSVLA